MSSQSDSSRVVSSGSRSRSWTSWSSLTSEEFIVRFYHSNNKFSVLYGEIKDSPLEVDPPLSVG